MANYSFETLSAHDFEALVRDLLQSELGVLLESFKAGRDLGIDLRYAPAKDNSLIVQCKHYAGSGSAKLISDLRLHEAPKVSRLSPQRYIIATSVGLSPTDKTAILGLFPLCKSTGDVYGKDDLNNLIDRHPHVEKSHYKLWLSSIHVLEILVKSTTITRTRLDLEDIHRKTKFYVQNASYDKAQSILDEQHYCIITGIPGIGKTTLAEALYVDHVSRGYEPVRIYRSIDEGFEMYKQGVRQCFYFDDFLGTTAFDESNFERNEDKQLLTFLHSVRKSSGEKKFILTSRDYILKQARMSLESVKATDLQPHLCTVNLHNYTRFNRAEILYNHLYFSQASTKQINDVLRDRRYFAIIDHPNYSPRVIEWMSQLTNRLPQQDEDFVTAFVEALDNPLELWRSAFERNISLSARYLLWVLVSLPDYITIDALKACYFAFERSMAELNLHAVAIVDFRDILEELEGTFIEIDLPSASVRVVRLHNPSIRDFLEVHLFEHENVVQVLARSAQFFSQLRWLWGEYRISFDHSRLPRQLRPRYRQYLLNSSDSFLSALARTLYTDERMPGLKNSTQRRQFRLASRVLLLLDVNSILNDPHLNELIAAAIDTLESRAQQGDETSFELMKLAKKLQGRLGFVSVKDAFLSSLSSLSDFQRFLIFKFRYSRELTDTDTAFVESHFRALFPNRKLLDIEDLDDYYDDDDDEDEDEDDFVDRDVERRDRDVFSEQRALEQKRRNPNQAIVDLFDGLEQREKSANGDKLKAGAPESDADA